MPNVDDLEVVRYHTAGRRQPMLVGKDAAGRPLWGGPYTIYQILGAIGIGYGLAATRGVWAAGLSPLATVLTVAAVAATAGWLLGRLDFAGRNPLWIAASLLRAAPALTARTPGTLAGRPLKPARAHHVRCRAAASTLPLPANPHPAAGPVTSIGAAEPTTVPVSVQPGRGPALTDPQPTPVGAVRQSALEMFLAAAGKAS